MQEAYLLPAFIYFNDMIRCFLTKSSKHELQTTLFFCFKCLVITLNNLKTCISTEKFKTKAVEKPVDTVNNLSYNV